MLLLYSGSFLQSRATLFMQKKLIMYDISLLVFRSSPFCFKYLHQLFRSPISLSLQVFSGWVTCFLKSSENHLLFGNPYRMLCFFHETQLLFCLHPICFFDKNKFTFSFLEYFLRLCVGSFRLLDHLSTTAATVVLFQQVSGVQCNYVAGLSATNLCRRRACVWTQT